MIFGNSAANDLNGSGGNDRLYGRRGNDFLSGNGSLVGGGGLVRLIGGTGADNLEAGTELIARAGDVDRNNLGSDAARDRFNAGISLDEEGFSSGFGVERVSDVGAQLDLGHSGWEASNLSQAFQQLARALGDLAVTRRGRESRRGPGAAANGGERIADAGLRFGAPSSASWQDITVEPGVGPARHRRA